MMAQIKKNQNTDKKNVNISVMGHVDHGKSTLTVRVLHDTGAIPKATIEKYKKQATAMGKGSFYLAWGMDNLKQQRQRGVTIDYNQKQFETEDVKFTIVDCPGHRDFIKNAMAGSAQTQAAILVVAGEKIVDGRPSPLQPQTKEHAFVLATNGISRIIVAINKCDYWKTEENYRLKKLQVEKFINLLFPSITVEYLPVSGLTGDNVAKKPEYLSWYKGKTLLQALNDLKNLQVELQKPPVFAISQVMKNVKGAGVVVTGVGYTGVIKKGLKYIIKPINKITQIKSIEKFHKALQQAKPFESVGMVLRGTDKRDLKKGYLICDINNHPKAVKSFIADIKLYCHPTALWANAEVMIHLSHHYMACKVDKIIRVTKMKRDAQGKPKFVEKLEEDGTVPKRVDNRCKARVRFVPKQKFIISTMSENSKFATFAMRDSNVTIGVGECIEVTPLDSEIGLSTSKAAA